jgi:anti-sigma regulatory factor (Ser/Thr protein kinase)
MPTGDPADGSPQRALLPDDVPVLPTLDVAGRYMVGADAYAGGDWFDVLPRHRRVVLVVGDVVGSGVAALVAMAGLRAVLLDRLASGASVAKALRAVDRRAVRDPGSFGATVGLVDIDPATGEFDYITAGHPPPLVVGAPDGDGCRFLAPTGAGPLGTSRSPEAHHGRLGDDEVLLLYTDGVIGLPTSPAGRGSGTTELVRAAEQARRGRPAAAGAELEVEHIVGSLVASVAGAASRAGSDDATVVAARRREPPPRLSIRIPTGPPSSAFAREAIRAWAAPLHPRPHDLDVLAHVVTELATNVTDHAYPTGTGTFVLHAGLHTDGQAAVTVVDAGHWRERPERGDGRGVGLALVGGLVDSLEVDGDEAGTTARARYRLSRPAGVVQAPAPHPGTAEAPFDAWHHRSAGAMHIGARGPLDVETLPEFSAHLAAATAPGNPSSTLDLRDVTVLASAAIQLILRARQGRDDLEIVAPAGSVAQHVLSLRAIPHRSDGGGG